MPTKSLASSQKDNVSLIGYKEGLIQRAKRLVLGHNLGYDMMPKYAGVVQW